MRRLHHSTRLWLYVLVGVALLLSAMLLPGSAVAWFYSDATAPGRWLVRLEQTAFPFSRWFHVAMFAWLALCLCRLFPRQPRWRLAALLLGLAVFGELLQVPVPGRTAGVGDVLDDLFGIGIGLGVDALWRWRRRRHLRRGRGPHVGGVAPTYGIRGGRRSAPRGRHAFFSSGRKSAGCGIQTLQSNSVRCRRRSGPAPARSTPASVFARTWPARHPPPRLPGWVDSLWCPRKKPPC